MMSAASIMAVLLSSAVVLASNGPTRLDPALHMALTDRVVPFKNLQRRLGAKAAGAVTLVDVFIKTSAPDAVENFLRMNGGALRSMLGAVVTAWVPLNAVEDLAALPEVEYVEAAQPMRRKLNQSIPAIQADAVQQNTSAATALGLTSAYTGSGVIVGVIDSGIDCKHADFTDASGNTRIVAYWDQTTGTGGVAEIANSTGTEYVGANLTGTGSGTCGEATDGDSEGHGTHVAGIAASRNSTYKGVAPAASIIAVKDNATDAASSGTFATTVVDAVNYIFRKAQTLHEPAVVNLSLGTSLGAHDGTSLFEQSLDALLKTSSGTDKVGRAIINAAGNENFSSADSGAATFGGIHALISQTADNKAFDFVVRSASLTYSSFGGATVDIWLNATSNCTVEVDAFSQTDKTTALINMAAGSAGGSTSSSSNTDGKCRIALDFTDSANANNGKQHAVATITRASSSCTAAGYSFDVIFRGTCTGDAWLYPDLTAALSFRKTSALSTTTNPAGYTYVSGDSNRTMTIPSTANKVIAVGSYMDAATWTDINSTVHDQTSATQGTGGTAGQVSLFSSLGPTPDGRTKPELVAPGEPIVSTLASNVSVSSSSKGDATHHELEGSSMSTPHVVGTVALMLQRNACLTPTQIKSALTSSVSTTGIVGTTLPDNSWGNGKLNALRAVAAVTASSCVADNSGDSGQGTGLSSSTGGSSTATTGGSVSSGGGSCTLVKTSRAAQ